MLEPTTKRGVLAGSFGLKRHSEPLAQVSALGLVGVPSPPKRQEGTTEMLDGLTRHLTYR